MPDPLTAAELEVLRKIPTPSAANAIETFNVRPRNVGFLRPEVRCMFPDLGGMIGYAVTGIIRAEQPPLEGHRVPVFQWWDYIQTIPPPRIVVLQDMDDPPGVGSFWGEVQANIHRALGCVGAVTGGGVRDLDEVRALGFHLFARYVLMSHAYVHLVDMGLPVKVGGMVVRPGDLVHGDQHGVHVIPLEIARELPVGVRKVEAAEREIIEACRAPDFTVERLKEVWKRVRG